MKNLLAGIILFHLYPVSYAQKIDSLQTVIQQTKTDTTKAILLSLLADELTKTNPSKFQLKSTLHAAYLKITSRWQVRSRARRNSIRQSITFTRQGG
jgi:hypothetical protein